MSTNYVIASWCYVVSSLLDAVDGHAARYYNHLGLPAVFPIESFTRFVGLSGDQAARSWLNSEPETLSVDMPEAVLDVDTDTDWQQLTECD